MFTEHTLCSRQGAKHLACYPIKPADALTRWVTGGGTGAQRSEAPTQEAGELALTASPVQLGLCPAPLLPVQTPVLAVVAPSECQWGGRGVYFSIRRGSWESSGSWMWG